MSTVPWRSEEWLERVTFQRARECAGDRTAALQLAVEMRLLGADLGTGTWQVLRTLASLGAADLSTARVVEPQVDAGAILSQAGTPDLTALDAGSDSTWGVYAAGGPGHHLEALPDGPSWRLTGTKPWCSLADTVSHALITAMDDGHQRLFAIRLDPQTTHTVDTGWQPKGLTDVTTLTLELAGTAAFPVGERGWYLNRPGFAWGGIGVAAVWFGAAASLAGSLAAAARARQPDQIAHLHLGTVDVTLTSALNALTAAAAQIDAGTATGLAGALLAARTRAIVAQACERVQHTVGHALGPAPLAFEPEHAQRVADLTLYLRQHHAERDLAALGRQLAAP